MLAYAITLLLMLPAGNHPVIKHPPDMELSQQDEQEIYAAIDRTGIKVAGLELRMGDFFGMGMPVLMVYGEPTTIGPDVTWGPILESREVSPGKYTAVSIGTYVFLKKDDSTRILVDGDLVNSDILGIIDAIRNKRISGREKIPSFVHKASILAIRTMEGQGLVMIEGPKKQENEAEEPVNSLLMSRSRGKWTIVAAGSDLTLPKTDARE